MTGIAHSLSQDVVDVLLAEAVAAFPCECCGLLLGNPADSPSAITTVRPVANVHSAPETHFEIDPAALIAAHRAARDGGARVLGYYHSHPNGRVGPSPTDHALAAGDGALWAIVAGGSITLWRDGKDGIIALPYCTVSG